MKKPLSHLLILALTFFIFSASSCHKDDPEPDLVPITTTGANTMGFYVDGVPHNKKGKYGGFIPQGVSGGISQDRILNIHGGGGEPVSSLNIYIPLDSLNHNNEYVLDKDIFWIDEVSFIDDGSLGGSEYNTDHLHSGKIKLLKITQNMASGTFYFDAINPETGKVIHVTDGRFDIQFF